MRGIALLMAPGLLVSAVALAESDQPAVIEDKLVVTAGLEEKGVEEVTAAVEIIEAEEITARQATTIAGLLATVPGLNVLQSGSAGKLTSTFVRGTESDHVLVLWNGIELNNPFFGGFDWAFLSTDGVDRVEVVRGPYSAVHGGEALGGVVQVLTGDHSGGSVHLEAGENDYWRGGLAAGFRTDRARIDVGGHVNRADGEIENDFFSSEELSLRSRWSFDNGLALAVVARANDSRIGIPFAAGRASPRRRSAWKERQMAAPLSWQRGSWQIESRLSHVHYDQRFEDPEDTFGFTASRTESVSERARAAATRSFGASWWLAFGGEIERLKVDDISTYGTALDGARQSTRSVFVEAAGNLGGLRLDVGIRHDDNDAFGSRASPRVGARLKLGDGAGLRASWGRGFRAPSLGELFYPLSGNSMLAPEESESWEVGMEAERAAWRFGVNVFENRLSNLIDFDFLTFTNVNRGRVESRGLELWSRSSGKTVSSAFAFTVLDAEDEATGEALLRRPDQRGSLVVTAVPGDWVLSSSAIFVGRREDVDPLTLARVELGSHLRIDVAARYEWRESMAPFARVENATNESYQDVAGFAAPGRRWIGGVSVAWGAGS